MFSKSAHYQHSDNSEEYFHTDNIFAKEIKDSFWAEYNKYFDTDYFFGCSFKVYKKTYKKRLEDFLTNFFDAIEMDFIESELKEGIFKHKFKVFKSDYLEDCEIQTDKELEKQILYSLKKRFEYLQQKANKNGFILTYKKSKTENESWSLEPIKQPLEVKKKAETTLLKWLPIGLGFATGEIQKKLITISARKIAKEYNLDSFHNYISCTNSNTIIDPKNIYSDFNKLKHIQDYCIENNIKICTDFMKAYNTKLKELN